MDDLLADSKSSLDEMRDVLGDLRNSSKEAMHSIKEAYVRNSLYCIPEINTRTTVRVHALHSYSKLISSRWMNNLFE